MKKKLQYIHALELDPKSKRQLQLIRAIDWKEKVGLVLKKTKSDSIGSSFYFWYDNIEKELSPIYNALGINSPIAQSWTKPVEEFKELYQYASSIENQFSEGSDYLLYILIKEFIDALKRSYKAVNEFLRNKKKYSFSINKRLAFRKIFQFVFKNLDDEDHSDDSVLTNVINQNLIINIKKRPNDRKRIYLSNQYITQFRD